MEVDVVSNDDDDVCGRGARVFMRLVAATHTAVAAAAMGVGAHTGGCKDDAHGVCARLTPKWAAATKHHHTHARPPAGARCCQTPQTQSRPAGPPGPGTPCQPCPASPWGPESWLFPRKSECREE
jgi:hypothetical protein